MALARWHIGTKAKTLQFIWEIEKQSPDIANMLSGMEDEEGITDWDVCVLECRVCGHRHNAVVPHEMSDENAECYECYQMTADVAAME